LGSDLWRRGIKGLNQGPKALDFLRIVLMSAYFILVTFGKGEFALALDLYVVMNLISWITIPYKYLRFSDKLANLVILVQNALISMFYFTIIMLLVIAGFATSLTYKAKMNLKNTHHFGQKNSFDGFYNLYMNLFADFGVWDEFKGHYDDDNTGPDPVDYLCFFLLSVFLAMLMFNLLVTIFSDTYAKMMEKEEANKYLIMNEILFDLDLMVS